MLFHPIYSIYSLFQNVAKIFHNVENVFTTSITAQYSSSDVFDGIVALTVTGYHSVPHTCIATRNTSVGDQLQQDDNGGSGSISRWSTTTCSCCACCYGDVRLWVFDCCCHPTTTKGLHMINRMFGSLWYP